MCEDSRRHCVRVLATVKEHVGRDLHSVEASLSRHRRSHKPGYLVATWTG